MALLTQRKTSSDKRIKESQIAARWGGDKKLFVDGFLSVPTRFLRGYARAKVPLNTEEAMFLLQLMTFKWGVENPYPSYERLGRMMGVSARTASRYASSLQAKGYLKRTRRQGTTNEFDLTPLFEQVKWLPLTRAEEVHINGRLVDTDERSTSIEFELGL